MKAKVGRFRKAFVLVKRFAVPSYVLRPWVWIPVLVAVSAFVGFKVERERAALDFEKGFYFSTARILRPIFKLGLLDHQGKVMLMTSLLQSHASPQTAMEVAEDCAIVDRDALCVIGQAQGFTQLQQYEAAESLLLRVLADLGDQPLPHLRLAEVAEKQGRFELAFVEYQTAAGLSQKENKTYPLLHLVQLLIASNHVREALDYVHELSDLSEGRSLDGLLAVARVYFLSKNSEAFVRTMNLVERLMKDNKTPTFYALSNRDLFDQYHRDENDIRKSDARALTSAEGTRVPTEAHPNQPPSLSPKR